VLIPTRPSAFDIEQAVFGLIVLCACLFDAAATASAVVAAYRSG